MGINSFRRLVRNFIESLDKFDFLSDEDYEGGRAILVQEMWIKLYSDHYSESALRLARVPYWRIRRSCES